MQDAPTSHRRVHLALTTAAASLAGAFSLLHSVPPAATTFYPSCPFHQLTGLLCPGCGATRALAALTHGNLTEALHGNPLVVAGVVALLLYAVFTYISILRNRPIKPPAPWLIAASLVVTATFTLWRNLV